MSSLTQGETLSYHEVMKALSRIVHYALALVFSILVVVWAVVVLFIASSYLNGNARAADRVEPVRVAVIDTGLDMDDPRFKAHLCESGHLDWTKTGLKDTMGHGTHVAGLIVANAGRANYCLVIVKYYVLGADDHTTVVREGDAFRWAMDNGAQVVNFSGGGPAMHEPEYLAIKSHPKVLFVVAAGNEGKSVTEPGDSYYPAAIRLPNVIVVGNGTSAKDRAASSNFGPRVDVWEDGREVESTLPGGKRGKMTGTSMATAIHTGKLLSRLAGTARDSSGSETAAPVGIGERWMNRK